MQSAGAVRGSSLSAGYHKRRSGDQRRLTRSHTPCLFRLSADSIGVSRWRADELQSQFQRHTEMLIRSSSVQIHFEDLSFSVVPYGTNQPVVDTHQPCLQRRHKVLAIFRKSPTTWTPVGSRIVVHGACKLSIAANGVDHAKPFQRM